MVELYASGRWCYRDEGRRSGYSVVLFGGHGTQYKKPDPRAVDELLGRPEISSIQVTFHDDRPAERHSMPPGGFRLAIVNCWDLQMGLEARAQLALLFGSIPPSAKVAA
jgi:hypothetical protein